jgi:hypothetical protein
MLGTTRTTSREGMGEHGNVGSAGSHCFLHPYPLTNEWLFAAGLGMDWKLVGAGAFGVVVGFIPMAIPKMPEQLAWAIILAAGCVVICGLVPAAIRPSIPQLALYCIGMACLAGSLSWQLQSKSHAARVPHALPTSAAIQPAAQKPDVPLNPRSASTPGPNTPPTGTGTHVPHQTPVPPLAQGGKGGSGEIFGDGVVIAGKGGSVGYGGQGRGGDGGGGVVHGNGMVIGGEGGSVDGRDIWYPPGRSPMETVLRQQGQTPDFGVMYPGQGGMSGGYASRYAIVVSIRADYCRSNNMMDKINHSKIEDVPLGYINTALSDKGYPWRARYDDQYWYVFFVPDAQ